MNTRTRLPLAVLAALATASASHAADVTWTGSDYTWTQSDANSFSANYQSGDNVTFGNTAITSDVSGQTSITLSGGLTPGDVIFNHTQARYNSSASNAPGGGFNYLLTSAGTANVINTSGNLILGQGNTIFRAITTNGTYTHTFNTINYSGGSMLGLSSDNASRFMTLSLTSLANPTAGNSLVFNSLASATGNAAGSGNPAWSSTSQRIVITGTSKPTITHGIASGGFQYYGNANLGGTFMKLVGDNFIPLVTLDYVANTFAPGSITDITATTTISSAQSAHAVRVSGANIAFDTGAGAPHTLAIGEGGLIINARSVGVDTNANTRGIINFGANHAWIGAYSASSQSTIHSQIIAGNGLTIMGSSQALNITASNNAITGKVHVNGGTANFSNGAISDSNDLYVGALGRFVPNTTASIGGLSGLGQVAAFTGTGTGSITISPASGSHTFGGTIVNGTAGRVLSVVKAGNGIQTFDTGSVGTYTGTTSVSAGTLLINGNFADATGAVTVSGGTLGGSGTIGGATTIESGGTLAPGNSPGLLTFNNSLTLAGAANFEINGTGRGTTYDAVNVGTALTYGGTLVANFGTTFGEGTYSFNLFDFASQSGTFESVSVAGSYVGITLNSGNSYTLVSGDNTWSFDHGTGVLGLTVAVIPEPSTFAALAGLGVLALAATRRRRIV